jgi:hypothetical protein
MALDNSHLSANVPTPIAVVRPIQKSRQIPVFLEPVFNPGVKKLSLDTASGYTTEPGDRCTAGTTGN